MADTEHKTTIKIEGDAKGAQGAIDKTSSLLKGKLVSSLLAVRTAMSAISRALGTFWLAWNGIQLVISGWQKFLGLWNELKTWESKNYVARMFDKAAVAADSLIGKQKQINELLAEQAKRQALVSEITGIDENAKRDAEDARREVSRAEALAGTTDPRARQVLMDRFAAEDEERQAEQAKRQRKEMVRELREEAALQQQIAERQSAHRQEVETELRRQRELLDTLEATKRPDEERLKATKDRIAALEKEWQAAYDAGNAAREARNAASFRADAYEATARSGWGAQSAGEVNRAAAWRAKDEADRKAAEEFAGKIAENEAQSAERRSFATMSDEEKIKTLGERESAARERMTAAQSELTEEMEKDVTQRSEERMQRARATIEQAQREALQAAESRESLERSLAAQQERADTGWADALARSFAYGGNRLTAMGLGDGSGPSSRTVEDINGKMTSVLNILRQELETMKRNSSNGAARFGV